MPDTMKDFVWGTWAEALEFALFASVATNGEVKYRVHREAVGEWTVEDLEVAA